MPDFENRNDIAFAKYDAMSTEELQALLREDASKPEGEETNMEVLFYVMEVLAKRRQARQEGKTPEKALDSFVKNYMPEVENASSSERGFTVRRHNPIVRRWTRGLVAAVAVIVLIMGTSFTANAFGFDLWGIVVKWTQDTFHFDYNSDISGSEEPNRENTNFFAGLQEALDNYDITLQLAPSWIPDGYTEVEVSIEDTPMRRQFVAKYQSNEGTIRIRIADCYDSAPIQIEQSGTLMEEYITNNISYYIFSNHDQLRAVWVNENFECFIMGPLSVSEMKRMIDSIGKD